MLEHRYKESGEAIDARNACILVEFLLILIDNMTYHT